MALEYRNLDDVTRQLMAAEVAEDLRGNKLYFSPRLSPVGRAGWAELFAEAINANHDDWLAQEIYRRRFLNETEERHYPATGTVSVAKVPSNAHEVLAEGEFNRFYMRGICLRAIDINTRPVAFRARYSEKPRSESERLIGQAFEPNALLAALRAEPYVDKALGMPLARIPDCRFTYRPKCPFEAMGGRRRDSLPKTLGHAALDTAVSRIRMMVGLPVSNSRANADTASP
ncbi:hypothetical protein OMK73_24260 [Cupriavidus sp. D39]|nr:hypothetical protein [Cupriavidus sp. D39]MCY0856446.1 hypothetical protein [Cupriavidus sp. D39]